jgi:hypothetical protein
LINNQTGYQRFEWPLPADLILNQVLKNQVSAESLEKNQVGNQEIKLPRSGSATEPRKFKYELTSRLPGGRRAERRDGEPGGGRFK